MVSGHTQAIDSAPVKANASMDSLELKGPKEELEAHLHSIRHISAMDKKTPIRKSKTNKAEKSNKELQQAQKNYKKLPLKISVGNETKTNVQEQEIKVQNIPLTKPIIVLLTPMHVSV